MPGGRQQARTVDEQWLVVDAVDGAQSAQHRLALPHARTRARAMRTAAQCPNTTQQFQHASARRHQCWHTKADHGKQMHTQARWHLLYEARVLRRVPATAAVRSAQPAPGAAGEWGGST